jgi:hypothetical protein
MEFSGAGSGWTDVTADVLYPITAKWGIQSNRPNIRVAQTGVMEFKLRNGKDNSGGLLGYYAPSNANVRSGFDAGIGVRLTLSDGVDTKRWYGRIPPVNGIRVETGQYRGRTTRVRVLDWMGQA